MLMMTRMDWIFNFHNLAGFDKITSSRD